MDMPRMLGRAENDEEGVMKDKHKFLGGKDVFGNN